MHTLAALLRLAISFYVLRRVVSGESRLVWFPTAERDVFRPCDVPASFPLRDASMLRALTVSPDVIVGFGYGYSCTNRSATGSNRYHDYQCSRSGAAPGAPGQKLLPALLVSSDGGLHFTCRLEDAVARYHASYGVIGSGRCQLACTLGGQRALLDFAYAVYGLREDTSVYCYHHATGAWLRAPDLPFAVLRATVTEYDGHMMVIGGIRPFDAAGEPLILRFNATSCSFPDAEGWQAVTSSRAAAGLASRIDMWHYTIGNGWAKSFLGGRSNASSALVVGGGIYVPFSERYDLLAFRYSDYLSAEGGSGLIMAESWYVDTPIQGCTVGCLPWRMLSVTALPSDGEAHYSSTQVLYPSYTPDFLRDAAASAVPQLLVVTGRKMWLSSSGVGPFRPVQHLLWRDDRFFQDRAPVVDHVALTIIPGLQEPVLWGMITHRSGAYTFRGFARSCPACSGGSGTYLAQPCQLSPFENMCRPCTRCLNTVSAEANATEWEVSPCTELADTQCAACSACMNGTEIPCGPSSDAVCLSKNKGGGWLKPPLPGTILVIGSLSHYSIGAALLIAPALVACLALCARTRHEGGLQCSTVKRCLRPLGLWAHPALSVFSYHFFDVACLVTVAQQSPLEERTIKLLYGMSTAGIVSSVCALFLTWLSLSLSVRLTLHTTAAAKRAQSQVHSVSCWTRLKLFMRCLLALLHPVSCYNLGPSMDMSAVLAGPLACWSAARQQKAGHNWMDSPHALAQARNIMLIVSCLLSDGVHLLTVLYAAVHGGAPVYSGTVLAVPALVATGLVYCALMNITLAAAALYRQKSAFRSPTSTGVETESSAASAPSGHSWAPHGSTTVPSGRQAHKEQVPVSRIPVHSTATALGNDPCRGSGHIPPEAVAVAAQALPTSGPPVDLPAIMMTGLPQEVHALVRLQRVQALLAAQGVIPQQPLVLADMANARAVSEEPPTTAYGGESRSKASDSSGRSFQYYMEEDY